MFATFQNPKIQLLNYFLYLVFVALFSLILLAKPDYSLIVWFAQGVVCAVMIALAVAFAVSDRIAQICILLAWLLIPAMNIFPEIKSFAAPLVFGLMVIGLTTAGITYWRNVRARQASK